MLTGDFSAPKHSIPDRSMVRIGFELGFIMKGAVSGRTHPPVERIPNFFELESSVTANRVVDLLGRLGVPAHLDSYTGGHRHRYTVYSVSFSEFDIAIIEKTWSLGCQRLSTLGVLTRGQREHQRVLAGAAWRAAALFTVKQPNRKILRIDDPALINILFKARSILDAPFVLVRSGEHYHVHTPRPRTGREIIFEFVHQNGLEFDAVEA